MNNLKGFTNNTRGTNFWSAQRQAYQQRSKQDSISSLRRQKLQLQLDIDTLLNASRKEEAGLQELSATIKKMHSSLRKMVEKQSQKHPTALEYKDTLPK